MEYPVGWTLKHWKSDEVGGEESRNKCEISKMMKIGNKLCQKSVGTTD